MTDSPGVSSPDQAFIRVTLIICFTVLLLVLGGTQACVANNRLFTEHGYCETTVVGSAASYWQKCKP